MCPDAEYLCWSLLVVCKHEQHFEHAITSITQVYEHFEHATTAQAQLNYSSTRKDAGMDANAIAGSIDILVQQKWDTPSLRSAARIPIPVRTQRAVEDLLQRKFQVSIVHEFCCMLRLEVNASDSIGAVKHKVSQIICGEASFLRLRLRNIVLADDWVFVSDNIKKRNISNW